MSTKRSFNDMLNDYLAYDLLKNETIKRNFLLNRIETDESWRGGPLIVPYQAGNASSFKYGGLTATNDVSENKYVRGQVDGYKEIWGTMKFHSRDLMEHGGSGGGDTVSEQSFLKNLPGTVEQFLDDMKQVVSVNFLNGTHFAKVTSDESGTDGVIAVDHPERFTINQKVIVKDSNSDITGYVREIDMNAKTVTLYDARVGGTALSFASAEAIASATGKFYVDGADTSTNAFTSLRAQLLSATNGGDSTQFGQTKTAHPFLQATNKTGAGISGSSDILDELFDFVNQHRMLGRMGANELVMSYKNLGACMAALELTSGPYKHTGTSANVYGWTTISVTGVKGEFKLTGVQEMDDDVIYLMDWRSLKLHTNQGFKKHKDPEGKVYYTVRETDGYVYYVDLCMYGELVVNKPALNGVLHSISW